MPCVHRGILAGLNKCSQGIFTGLKHREFCATFVPFVPNTPNFVPQPLWEILTYALCRLHRGILAGLSVPREFSRV